MAVIISDDLIRSTGLTDVEFRRELALWLYQHGSVSLMWAAKFAGIERLAFEQLLADRDLHLTYGSADLDADLATLKQLGRL